MVKYLKLKFNFNSFIYLLSCLVKYSFLDVQFVDINLFHMLISIFSLWMAACFFLLDTEFRNCTSCRPTALYGLNMRYLGILCPRQSVGGTWKYAVAITPSNSKEYHCPFLTFWALHAYQITKRRKVWTSCNISSSDFCYDANFLLLYIGMSDLLYSCLQSFGWPR